jgi:hypothetical protein
VKSRAISHHNGAMACALLASRSNDSMADGFRTSNTEWVPEEPDEKNENNQT